ncbi:FAD-dependent monooxygenase [Paludisphaera sp.]|uniref:FAD-dependent monooxygenase n=1 Tax=Paludisphaera sp. TaxID=2017432 RepID=UPI00301CF0E8
MADWIDREVDVLIAGAGPSGLSLAVELRRQGTDCALIEAKARPTPERESRALAIHAATMEAFQRMGIAGRMREEGRVLHGFGAYRGDNRILGLRLALAPDETRFPFILILPQGRTEQLLLDRLNELDGDVEWGTRLESFKTDMDGVTAELKDDEGRTSYVRAKWLIGCDGTRSVVRQGVGLEFRGREYPERFLLADAEVSWGLPADEASILLTPEGALVAVPLPDEGRWRLIDATGRSDAATPEAVLARLQRLAGPISGMGGKVGEAAWTSSFVIHRRVVDRYRAGRVLVAGDAAHLHSPAGGQGLNVGVQDVVNLAWKLAMVVRGEAVESLLDSYDAERRPVAARVLWSTDRIMRLIAPRNPMARVARDAVVAGLGRIDVVSRRIARELAGLSVSYRRSPIVDEARPGWLYATSVEGATGFNANESFRRGPKPGERLPDVILAQSDPATGLPLRLSDVVHGEPALSDGSQGPRHVLLVFQGIRPESGAFRVDFLTQDFVPPHLAGRIRPILVEPRVPVEKSPAWRGERLSDPTNSLHRRFGAEGACLFLVRPDGYIGFRARPLDPLPFREYTKRIFS